MPVSFSYSGESVLTKKASEPLMNELSWTTPMDLTAAPAGRGARAAAVPPTRARFKNSRRVLMGPPPSAWRRLTARGAQGKRGARGRRRLAGPSEAGSWHDLVSRGATAGRCAAIYSRHRHVSRHGAVARRPGG